MQDSDRQYVIPSPLQRAMIADEAARPGQGYNIDQLIVELPRDAPIDGLAERWRIACDRYDALRHCVAWSDEGPMMKDCGNVEPILSKLQFPSERAFEEWLEADRRKGFDLGQAPLHRCALVAVADELPRIVWSVHHVIVDGRSYASILHDALLGAGPHSKSAPRFADYLRLLAQADRASTEARWREWLAGLTGGTRLNLPPERNPERGEGALSVTLERADIDRLAHRARELNITLFTFAQAAWAIVLSRYSSTDDVVFGSVMSDRWRLGDAGSVTVGNFVYVAPTRIRLDEKASLVEALHLLRQRQLETRELVPLDMDRYASCAGLSAGDLAWDSILLYERRRWDEEVRSWGGAWQQARTWMRARAPVAFSIIWIDRTEGAELRAEYERARIGDRFAQELLRRFRYALTQLAEASLSERMTSIDIADAREQSTWSCISGDWLPAPTNPIEEVVARVCAIDADKPFVVEGDRVISRKEFIRSVDAVAACLTARGVKRGEVVPVYASRGAAYYAAIVGVLRAGGAFLPLEKDREDARIPGMLRDVACRFGLFAGRSAPIDASAIEWIDVDTLEERALDRRVEVPLDAPAYVMYTSGSTGTPKGVVISRANLAHYIDAIDAVYRTQPDDVMLQFSSIQFDASIEEIFLPLARGLVVVARPPGAAPEPSALCNLIERTGVTILDFPTAYWAEWTLALALSGHPFPSRVRLVALGGEEARSDVYRLFRSWAGPRVRWMNTYGPTECTVAVTAHEPALSEDIEGGIPIGHPLRRTSAWLLDHRARLVPPGAVGELAIGGAGVGCGYLGRPDETEARFIQNPFRRSPDPVLYKTGDRARLRDDGALEFLGRGDEQVKIRGFRVEPGEAAAAIRAHPAVRDAAVIAIQQGQARALAAFWVERLPVDVDDLRTAVSTRLPDYLRPTLWIRIDQIPLTPNGKIDLAFLSRLAERSAVGTSRTPPAGEAEEVVARVWRALFGLESVGREDDFFSLGGHSLLALRFLSMLRAEGWALDPVDLFQDGSLPAVARALRRAGEVGDAPANARSVKWIRRGSPERVPLVIAPSDFGDLLVYANFIDHLNSDRPCIGLDCTWLADAAQPPRALEELAARLADELCETLREPSAAFIGYCFGGYLAMELARAWRFRGRSVAWLGLIDARPFGPIFSFHYLLTQLRAASRAKPSDWARFFRTRLRQRLHALRLAMQGNFRPEALSRRDRVQWLMYHRVAARYCSPTYEGPLHFFYAAGSRFDLYGDPTGGWLDWAERVRVHKTPGTHMDMMKPPNARALAMRVEAALQAEENRHRQRTAVV